jgi:hypothetical protein
VLGRILWACPFQEFDMKHNKLIAALALTGGLAAMSGAAHAISPAAAIGLAAIGGAAVGSAAAQANPPAVAVVPSSPTVVMGAAPAVEVTTPAVANGYYVLSNGVPVWVSLDSNAINLDHDRDGVLNQNDRFPNDGTRS